MLSSCSQSLGWGVVLWTDVEHGIYDGELVRVYIKSNIMKKYVVSKDKGGEKIELPIWQVSEPQSLGKAKKTATSLADYAHTYASVKLDGLPIREESVNTSKQIYRLRKGEVIRVLLKGQGETVSNGKGNMEGDWLRVLTSNGTEGWCFSHNLSLFKAGIDGKPVNGSDLQTAQVTTDSDLDEMTAKKWYPETFRKMIRDKHIDPLAMQETYGFDFGKESGTVTLKTDSVEKEWPFGEIKKIGRGKYEFKDIGIQITAHGADSITVRYMDSDGKTKDAGFVTLEENVADLVSAEMNARKTALSKIKAAGPDFRSESYGQISFESESSLYWSGFNLLVPNVIPSGAKNHAQISITNFISDQLKKSYDGILTFEFDGLSEKVYFLYKLTGEGIRLESTAKSAIRDGVLTARASSPTVMFFSSQVGN